MSNQTNSDIEKRSFDGAKIRMHDKDKREIEGYGIVFNKRFEIWEDYFEEIDTQSGAFFRADGIDIIGAFNHNFDKILGRSKAGTMRFEVDNVGVKYIIQVANTSYGDDLLESVERGDIRGSSFVFRAKAVEWREEENGVTVRVIKEFADVIEMGPVVRPAYKDTTVAKRSYDERQNTEEKTDLLKEQIQKEHIKRAHAVRKVRLAALFQS